MATKKKRGKVVYGIAFDSLAELALIARDIGAVLSAETLEALVATFRAQEKAGTLPTKQTRGVNGIVMHWISPGERHERESREAKHGKV